MKKTITIILIIILSLSFISCTKKELTDREMILGALESDFKFKSETGKEFTGESALYAMKGLVSLIEFYKLHLEEDYASVDEFLEEAEELQDAKNTYAKNETEKEIYDKIMYCYKNYSILDIKRLQLEEMEINKKINAGGITEEDINEKKEEIKIQEEVLESSILKLLDYFEY